MKRKILQLSIGASVLVALSSCSSPTDENFYGDLKATPRSEVTLEEDMIPPWVDGGESIANVPAHANTPTYDRNSFAIPEPGETVPTTGASATRSQQDQPVIVKDAPISDPAPLDPVTGLTTPDPVTPGASVVEYKPKVTKKKPKVTKKPKPRTKKAPKITKPSILVYKVRSGDNLSVIAQRCGTTVSAIRRASGIKGSTIYAGQTIKVPYTPKAMRHIKATKRGGSSSKSSSSSRSSGRSYTIRSGDTISGIAARYGVSSSSILKLNGISAAGARRLSIGQKIRIPNK